MRMTTDSATPIPRARVMKLRRRSWNPEAVELRRVRCPAEPFLMSTHRVPWCGTELAAKRPVVSAMPAALALTDELQFPAKASIAAQQLYAQAAGWTPSFWEPFHACVGARCDHVLSVLPAALGITRAHRGLRKSEQGVRSCSSSPFCSPDLQWELDSENSSAAFVCKHVFSNVRGMFQQPSGTIILDDATPPIRRSTRPSR
jgi:hypothetical protein